LEFEQMGTAIVGVVGSLLGVLLGFLGQSFRARQEHKWAIETAKREVYSEFLRSISASYAQAKSEAKSRQIDTAEAVATQSRVPEDADLLAATAAIELLANQTISRAARKLSNRVIETHVKLRRDLSIDRSEVPGINKEREKLIELFQKDLRIPLGDQQISNPANGTGPSDPTTAVA
jgi:hypothetical protein